MVLTGQKKNVLIGVLTVATSVALTGCASDTSAELKRIAEENAKLKEEIKQLQAGLGSPGTTRTSATDTSSSSSAPTTGGGAEGSSFTDIKGAFGEEQIKDLAKLGVLDPKTSSEFQPSKPVTRAEFVTWLVTSNNLLRPEDLVRMAEPTDKSTFTDLKSDHPMFKYIQGMANAGWSIGYEDNTFKPDKALTREEMLAIKVPFDKLRSGSNDYDTPFTDQKKIQKKFFHAVSVEAYNSLDYNWKRIFGSTKTCDPQKTVSRAEAAVCVSQIGTEKATASALASKPTVTTVGDGSEK